MCEYKHVSWLVWLTVLVVGQVSGTEPGLWEFRETKDVSRATVRIHAGTRSTNKIPAFITGKFCEHLGANIYNGMEAQVLRNATLADFPFWNGQMTPDGVTLFHSENDKINQELRRQASRAGWPDSELDKLVSGRGDGLACWWIREGEREAVQVSPDTGPQGGRAQRLQVRSAGQGLAQWAYLPLHRIRKYEVEIFARSPDITGMTISLTPEGADKAAASAAIEGLSSKWQKLTGKLALPADVPAGKVGKFALTANSPGQMVIARIFLRPADHINGADPDVIRLLKESHLPLLRWPGGNFVSGYHWEDGVGPLEGRPTVPNYAWGGVEPNTFGTDEFMAFCQAVGCEPMICINGGNGTPAEAARWIEYCNGPINSPMGARRAANGHPQPYNVRHWEVGNELWGHWQYNWTTASGYVDRYTQFSKAMLAADPTIHLYACGAPVFWGKQWNDTLFAGAAKLIGSTTDHPLIGGDVPPSTEPLDVYRDFMAVPGVLETKWAQLEASMRAAGVQQPRLAVTELQLFAHISRNANSDAPVKLHHDNLVNPGTLAEGIYDVLIYHSAVRLGPFVELVTHSATVNHGGGLRKERERVYANPCYYAQAAFAAFGGATPVAMELESSVEIAPRVLPELRNTVPQAKFHTIDALPALAADGSLLLSIVHRGSAGSMRVALELDGFKAASAAEVLTLTGNVPWAVNSLGSPDAIHPIFSKLNTANSKAELEVPPYTVARVRFPPQVKN